MNINRVTITWTSEINNYLLVAIGNNYLPMKLLHHDYDILHLTITEWTNWAIKSSSQTDNLYKLLPSVKLCNYLLQTANSVLTLCSYELDCTI